MSITLITGLPGTGKTAHAVDMIEKEYRDRPVFQMGILDLAMDHEPVPPVAEWTEEKASPEDPEHVQFWFTFPPNSVVIIDEAQTVFRPRPVGSRVPPEVQAFETHRHLGIDFVLITQHPGLIDSNIRKLVGRHRHIRSTALGRHMFEWGETGDPESTASRSVAAKTRYTLPKHVFGRYKSAEIHTKSKTRMPIYVYLFVACLIGFAVAGWRVFDSMSAKVAPLASVPMTPSSSTGKEIKPVSLTYAEKEHPRLADYAHTAPKYDEVTKPIDAPWPAGCMVVAAWRGNPEKCRCVDQQGNRYATSDSVCRGIVKNGIFKDWGKSPSDAAQPQQARDMPYTRQRSAGNPSEGDSAVVLPSGIPASGST